MQSTYVTRFASNCRRSILALVLPTLWALGSGCNAAVPPAGEGFDLGRALAALDDDNGLTTNGLTTNGLTTNGLTTNGLTTNGLSSSSFQSWFANNGDGDLVMRYVVRCALPAGQSLTWTNPATQVTYTWQGNLGLAPGWASGQQASLLEQQLVSACLAAHVNKYAVSVTISVLGVKADGTSLAVGANELSTWSVREACFFGNLFPGNGGTVYAGSDRVSSAAQSSDRACALSTLTPGSSTQCGPMVYVGSCATYCTLDATGTWYESCTYNGVTYRPLTTRVQPSDVYTCGDGVCQNLTESCGAGSTPAACSDCGACP